MECILKDGHNARQKYANETEEESIQQMYTFHNDMPVRPGRSATQN